MLLSVWRIARTPASETSAMFCGTASYASSLKPHQSTHIEAATESRAR